MADTAVCVGPAASSASYLNIEAIMDAIHQTKAQAVHPGYGFLSENAHFAEMVEKAGVAFVGPGPGAISAMGDKIESKRIAMEAGVTTIPGFQGILKDEDEAVKVAIEVGFPVMIKASAGGGGKGMRIAWNAEEAAAGFAVSSREAASAFGDNRIFIERYVDQSRHIEIQLLADAYGECVYLPERECSIQRRNQKVVEEAPAAHLSRRTVEAMGKEAVALAKAVGYRSAGTLEFLVDAQQQHYFLEMNTRLQVEHPVTEMVSGIDLVEAMLRVAAGERMWLKQEDLRPIGWAIESRLYAEDPLRGFLPSIGTLKRYKHPEQDAVVAAVDGIADTTTGTTTGTSTGTTTGTTTDTDSVAAIVAAIPAVRVDDGVREGSEIAMHYDPMISKLVTHGRDRDHARQLMIAALDRYIIRGLVHNQNFLRSLMCHERFASGQLTTSFIKEEYPDGYHGYTLSPTEREDMLAAVASLQHAADAQARTVATVGVRAMGPSTLRVRIGGEDDETAVRVETEAQSSDVMCAGDVVSAFGAKTETSREFSRQMRIISTGLGPDGLFEATVDGAERNVVMQVHDRSPLGWEVCMYGTRWSVLSRRPRFAELSSHMLPPPPSPHEGALLSPMPGVLVSIAVGAGDMVVAGQQLCVVEAMKMQNVILAERNAVVQKVFVDVGATLATDDPIVAFEP